MAIEFLFEDDAIIVANKPPGLKSHGGEYEKSLESEVSAQVGRRMILLHRLDRDTSGIILLAKRKDAAGKISQDFEGKKIRKAYFAVVDGDWKSGWSRIEQSISSVKEKGKMLSALTTFRVLGRAGKKSWLEAMPKSGRRHQIRIHCASMGRPVCGDVIYGQGHPEWGLALHAYRIDFQHPITQKPMRIFASPPKAWLESWLNDFDHEKILSRVIKFA